MFYSNKIDWAKEADQDVMPTLLASCMPVSRASLMLVPPPASRLSTYLIAAFTTDCKKKDKGYTMM